MFARPGTLLFDVVFPAVRENKRPTLRRDFSWNYKNGVVKGQDETDDVGPEESEVLGHPVNRSLRHNRSPANPVLSCLGTISIFRFVGVDSLGSLCKRVPNVSFAIRERMLDTVDKPHGSVGQAANVIAVPWCRILQVERRRENLGDGFVEADFGGFRKINDRELLVDVEREAYKANQAKPRRTGQ